MKHMIVTLTTALMLTTATMASAHDCETELGETFRDLKDSMRRINRLARSDDSETLAVEVDKAVELTREAGEQQPLIYEQLSGDQLEEAKSYYSDGISELEVKLLSLKEADFDEVDDILDSIKSLQKKSHKKLKEC